MDNADLIPGEMTAMDYELVTYVVRSFFNYSHGLSTDDDEKRLLRSLENSDFKQNLKTEVLASLSDLDFSWLELLKKYDFAYNHEIQSEEAARQWAKECLFDKYLV